MGTQWPSSHLAFGGAINGKWGFQSTPHPIRAGWAAVLVQAGHHSSQSSDLMWSADVVCNSIQIKSSQLTRILMDIESVNLFDQNFIGTKWMFSQPPQWPEQGHVLIGSAVQQWGVQPTPHPIYHWPGQGQIFSLEGQWRVGFQLTPHPHHDGHSVAQTRS